MLNQLVESKNTSKENKTKNALLLVTLTLVFGTFISALGYSLFTQDLFIDGEGLELSTLVAPPIPEEAPPPVEEEPEQKQEQQKTINADIRKDFVASMDLTPPEIPKTIDNTPYKGKTVDDLSRPMVKGPEDGGNFDPSKARPDPGDLKDGTGFSSGDNNPKGTGTEPSSGPPPPPPPPPPPAPPPVPKRISGGVVNGKATSLPTPAYPAAARAANIKGSVNVAIVISKTGSVMSASAVSGHPLLRSAAVSAARRARFAPTLLSGQPVEVSGVIVYNFQ
jgi:periplasmic protein TonB